jgi:regulator of replication initiation timing
LERATDNLLEKQQKLENEISNLKKDIRQKSQQLTEEKKKVEIEKEKLKNRIDKIIGDKNAWFNYKSESLEIAIDKLFGNHQIYVESTGDKCVRVVTAPFK